MQKYFDLLLELLRPEDDDFVIEERKKLSAAAKKIEEEWNKNLKIGTVHHEEKMTGDGYDAMVSALNIAWQSAVDEMVMHIDN